MHARFKDIIPPPFDPNNDRGYRNRKSLEDPHRNGVYCNWDGWLYDSNDGHFHHYFKTSNGDALFTFIDVYCHSADKTVRYFAKAVGGNNLSDNSEERPFHQHRDNATVIKDTDPLPHIGCNWTGWLFWDMTKKTWVDDGKRKFSYERYYAIDDKKNSDSKKGLGEWAGDEPLLLKR